MVCFLIPLISDHGRRVLTSCAAKKDHKYALFWAIVKCLRWEVAGLALPRLCLVALSMAQPFMISRAVAVLQLPDPFSLDMGYGLIGAFALVFIGSALMKAAYEHLGYRATTMIRGGMIAVVYQKMMDLPSGSVSESSAMSLMGSDIEALAEYFHATICDTWANILQLGLATWLLYTQMGAVCVAPIIVAIGMIGHNKLHAAVSGTDLGSLQLSPPSHSPWAARCRKDKNYGLRPHRSALISQQRPWWPLRMSRCLVSPRQWRK